MEDVNDALGIKESGNESDAVSKNLSDDDFRKDVRIIRGWVQFFGWLTIIAIVITALAYLVMLVSSDTRY